MAKYAAVVTATGDLIPGVNALLNGLKYYDNDVDFHYLYTEDHLNIPYVQSVQDSGLFPNFFPIKLRDYITEIELRDGAYNQTMTFYLMAFRYLYAAELKDYDAVVVFDADEAIVNSIMWFLDIAAKTDYIIAPNNGLSGEEYDHYQPKGHYGLAGSIIYNHPFFFSPAVYGDLLRTVPKVTHDLQIADISGLHDVLKSNGLMGTKVFVQPGVLWITIFTSTSISERYIGGKRFLMTGTSDRLYSIHGRWWYASNAEKFSVEPKSDRDRANNWNTRLLWETYYFFNTQCCHNIPWNTKQWGEPTMFATIGSGNRW